jgi:beta-galactosidase
MVKWANHPTERRPVIWCEYAHAMGNSLGNFYKFWDAIRSNHRMIGAFVWDWTDQGILQKDKEGRAFWAYGGDFGDTINSENFCLNGIIGPDQHLKPAIWEAKKVMQPVQITAANLLNGKFTVRNWHHEGNLNQYAIEWVLLENGTQINKGVVSPLNIPAATTGAIEINFGKPNIKPGAEYILRVYFNLAKDEKWASKGHNVAWEEFVLPFQNSRTNPAIISGLPAVQFSENEKSVSVKGNDFEAAVSKVTGALISYKIKGKEIIKSPLVPNFWRPPTDNDRGTNMVQQSMVWKTAGKNVNVSRIAASKPVDQVVNVVVELELPEVKGRIINKYSFYGDGQIKVDYNFTAGKGMPNLPRVGMQMAISDEFDQLEWYGLGPHETYSDRLRGAWTGIHKISVKNDFFHYAFPQESNNRSNTRWAKLVDSQGNGIMISGEQPLSFSAWPYSMEDIEQATHINKLNIRDFITLNIDLKQQGVGGDDSWSQRGLPHPEYRIPAGNYRYSFVISPVTSGKTLVGQLLLEY